MTSLTSSMPSSPRNNEKRTTPRFISSENSNIKDVLAKKTSISIVDTKKIFNTIPGETVTISPRSSTTKSYCSKEPNVQIRFEFFVEKSSVTFKLCFNKKLIGEVMEFRAGKKHKFIFQPAIDDFDGEIELIWANKHIFQSKQIKFAIVFERISTATLNLLQSPPSSPSEKNDENSNDNNRYNKGNIGTETEKCGNLNNNNINNSNDGGKKYVGNHNRMMHLAKNFEIHYVPHENMDEMEGKLIGTYGNLTENEQKIFNSFKALVTPDEIKVIKIPFEKDDCVLLRFLRARKFVIKETKLMWDNHLKWREDSELHSNLNRTHKEIAGMNLQELCNFYPTGYGGSVSCHFNLLIFGTLFLTCHAT